jgi:predicted TIM-barrel fold metal-dependent hydrolase
VSEEASYQGPIIDTFLHGPWIGPAAGSDERADRVQWIGDRRLRRVMRTFSHDKGADSGTAYLAIPDLLAAMDGSGVERGILATKVYYSAPADGVTALNRQFASMAADSNGRLKWIASLIPPELGGSSYWDVMQNSRLLDEFGGDPGLCGVHVTPSPWGILPSDRWFYPAYAKCVELRLPLFTYVGAPGPLWPMDLNNPAHLDEVALAFPDLTIIAHHIGDPWTDMAVRLAARHEHFYICTSAWSPKAYPGELKQFLAGKWHGVRGCDKTIFASDYPLLDLATVVRDARALPLDAERAEKFLFANAQRLFWS